MLVHSSTSADSRPEAMADVPGACDLQLTRAIIQYRDVHETQLPGGRIQDIGLGLVLEGRYASSAQVIDLGSGSVRSMDLSTELVILDWAYEPTLMHVHSLVVAEAHDPEGRDPARDSELRRYCFRIALGVLDRLGFSYLTRPSLLRVGFRDVCRDLDLHEGTAFRLVLGERRVARIHMNYESGGLVVSTGRSSPDPIFEDSLTSAFPSGELRRGKSSGPTGSVWYTVRFPLPLTMEETQAHLLAVRKGMERLLARFEPDRHRALRDVLSVLGTRNTLARLAVPAADVGTETVTSRPSSLTVH